MPTLICPRSTLIFGLGDKFNLIITMPTKKKAKPKPKKKLGLKDLKIEDVVRVCHENGLHINFSLEPKQPERLPNDPGPVKLLLDECERMTTLGMQWTNGEKKNPVAADMCFNTGNAYYLSACWLRAKLDGSIARAQDSPPKA